MISIIDYGVGNVKAFTNVYKRLGIECKLVREPDDLINTTKIILPGVGHFDYAMKRYRASGLDSYVEDCVKEKKIPTLGICVGMQMMAKSSSEGRLEGLGWIDAHVVKFNSEDIKVKPYIPHMGWNSLEIKSRSGLLDGMEESPEFYFLHSYYFKCNNEQEVMASCNYGIQFAAIVQHQNIYGVQCHPEKSHKNGQKLLENFAKL